MSHNVKMWYYRGHCDFSSMTSIWRDHPIRTSIWYLVHIFGIWYTYSVYVHIRFLLRLWSLNILNMSWDFKPRWDFSVSILNAVFAGLLLLLVLLLFRRSGLFSCHSQPSSADLWTASDLPTLPRYDWSLQLSRITMSIGVALWITLLCFLVLGRAGSS